MDFHTLSRKQLQALCKKNKIPANITNVAMADSLAALEKVEGIEEFLNSVDTDTQKFLDEKGAETPACRTSTRRKPVMEEPGSTKVSTRLRRGTRSKNDEEIDLENKDLNIPVTPAAPTTGRRAPAASTRRKKEDEKPTDHVPKTPAASKSRVKAASAYNTRKSVRLLEKGLSKMNLMDKEETGSVNVDTISEGLSSVSQQMEDSEDTENGASSQMISTEVIEKTDESELTSSEKNLSKVSFVDADGTESVKVDEISEEVTDLPQKIEESGDAVEGANSKPKSIEVIETADELEPTSSGENTESGCKSNDCISEMPSDSEEASDTGASLPAELQESLMEINKSGSPSKDMNNSSELDVELIKSNAKEMNDAINKSDVGNDIPNPALMLSSHAENEAVVEIEGNSAEIHLSKVDEVDASMMVVEEKNEVINIQEEMIFAENKAVETAHDIENSEEMFSDEKEIIEVEELGFKTSSDIEEPKEYEEKDAVMEVCSEPSSEEGNTNVQILTDSVPSEGNTNARSEPSSEEGNTNVQILADSVPSEGNMNAHGVADFQSPLVTNEAKAESETADVQSSLVRNEAEAESETTNVQSVADSQSSVVTNEAKEESETADVQSSLVRNEDEAEYKTTDVQIGNEEDCKENADVPTSAPINSEQTATDVPIQFAYQDQSAPKSNAAVEVKSVKKMSDEEGDKQKENQNNVDLTDKSIRQLRRQLREMLNTNNDKNINSLVKEVERKRTALQELPENQMTATKGQPLLP